MILKKYLTGLVAGMLYLERPKTPAQDEEIGILNKLFLSLVFFYIHGKHKKFSWNFRYNVQICNFSSIIFNSD